MRDLVEVGIGLERDEKRRAVKAKAEARGRGPHPRRPGRADREPGHPRQLPEQAAGERTRRQGDRDRARRRRARAACRCSRSPACPAPRWARSTSATCSARRSAASRASRAGSTVQDAYAPLMAEESDKLLDAETLIVRRRSAQVEDNGIVFLDEIDKICAREGRSSARRLPRGRAARPAAPDRGHDRLDQARAGEDRPHPVHRVAAPSTSRSPPTCCRSCRAGCRSASSCSR